MPRRRISPDSAAFFEGIVATPWFRTWSLIADLAFGVAIATLGVPILVVAFSAVKDTETTATLFTVLPGGAVIGTALLVAAAAATLFRALRGVSADASDRLAKQRDEDRRAAWTDARGAAPWESQTPRPGDPPTAPPGPSNAGGALERRRNVLAMLAGLMLFLPLQAWSQSDEFGRAPQPRDPIPYVDAIVVGVLGVVLLLGGLAAFGSALARGMPAWPRVIAGTSGIAASAIGALFLLDAIREGFHGAPGMTHAVIQAASSPVLLAVPLFGGLGLLVTGILCAVKASLELARGPRAAR